MTTMLMVMMMMMKKSGSENPKNWELEASLW